MSTKHKATFAVIDDDSVLRHLIQGILRDEGLEQVSAASTGEQGLKDCHEHSPDLVMLDINLPGTGGMAVLKALKRNPHPPKVIMISSEATAPNVTSALALGADGFVVKPFNAAKLLTAVKIALREP